MQDNAAPAWGRKDAKRIEAGGHSIRYVAQGSGTPLLLIHGLTGHLENWSRNIDALAARYRVIALDLIGSGQSDMPQGGDFSQARMVRSLVEFLDAMGIERAHVCGVSMGGRLTLHLAHHAPDRVLSVIPVAPAGFGRETFLRFRLASVPWLGERLPRPKPENIRAMLADGVFDPACIDEEMVALKRASGQRPGAKAAFLGQLRDLVRVTGFRPDRYRLAQSWLPGIRQPALLIWGRNDRLVPARHAGIIRARLPGVKVKIYDRCGHQPHQEYPDRFNSDVLGFLDGLSPASPAP